MSFGYDVYEYSRRGDLEGLKEALATNKPDTYMAYDGSTALLIAARSGHGGIVKELLSRNASVNVRTDEGSTPLHHAVSGGAIMAVHQMLKAGVSVNEQNEEGVTPLLLAASYGQRATCQLLLERRADVNVDGDGWGTALDNAKGEVHELLQQHGAKRSERGAGQNEAKGGEKYHYGCFEAGATHGSGPAKPAAKVPVRRSSEPDGIRASPEGTQRFLADKLHAEARPRMLGSTGLTVSPVGFGCHRVQNLEEHRAAMALAVTMGCNLIDLAPNYTDGVAESVAGAVIQDLLKAQQVRRDELIITTKVGNVLGEQLRFADGVPGMTRINDNLMHCISPAWIEQELTRSLERLQLPCVDFLLLHCPEYELKAPDVDMEEVYARIAEACKYLELEVSKGRIGFYGLSAAFVPLRPTDPEHLDLARVLGLLPKEHHFRVLQFPVNFAEAPVLWLAHGARSAKGALLQAEEATNSTLLELAEANGLGVLANRPLDGIWREAHGVLRFSSLDCDVRSHSELQLENCDALEEKLTQICRLDRAPFSTGQGAAGELASKTVKALASSSGIDCVLLGMRQPTYVAETLPLAFQTPRLEAQQADLGIKNLHQTIAMWYATAISESDHGTSKSWRLDGAQRDADSPIRGA